MSDQSTAAAREQCHAQSDGDCSWERCPQLRDGEPKKSGRHCPLDVDEEDEEADWLDEYIADAQQDRREITDINCYAMGNADGRLEAAHTFRAKLRAASRQSGAAPSTAPTEGEFDEPEFPREEIVAAEAWFQENLSKILGPNAGRDFFGWACSWDIAKLLVAHRSTPAPVAATEERERCRMIAGRLGDNLAMKSWPNWTTSQVCRLVIAIAHSIEGAGYGGVEEVLPKIHAELWAASRLANRPSPTAVEEE